VRNAREVARLCNQTDLAATLLAQPGLDPPPQMREPQGDVLVPLLSMCSMESREDADLQLERSTLASRASKGLALAPHGPFGTSPRSE